MQTLVRCKTLGVTGYGGRGTAGAGPGRDLLYTSELYLVSFLLAIILSHNVVLAPGGHCGGVFRQLVGFSMETNAAPAWGNLIARAYERATPLPPTVAVYRYLDDGCICYPLSLWGWVYAWLKRTYPPHLPLDLMCTNSTGRFSLLDLYVISLSPLHHHTYFKETHSCAYVPWNSNVPRSTKTGWITGECIRHLRKYSHRPCYQAVLRRLQLSLVRLRYPKHLWERFPITWDQRHRYVGKRPKQQGSVTHVLRAPYSSVINASLTSVIRRLEHSLKCLVFNLQMFVTHTPAPPLRAKWASRLWSTLSGKNDEVCPNEEPGSTLASLLLNVQRAAPSPLFQRARAQHSDAMKNN